MIDLNDVRSLTDFLRNTPEHLRRLREKGKPQVLTIKGRAELVVQSAAAYQQLLDRVAGPAPHDRPAAAAVTDAGRGQQ